MKMRVLIPGLVLLALVQGVSAFGGPLAAPVLSVTTSRIVVTISWSEVEGAEGYLFYYAPYPGGIPVG
jgi:hypothetical protein